MLNMPKNIISTSTLYTTVYSNLQEKDSTRSLILDFLKGIAIISVILYHTGLFKCGYLVVDIFIVITGYLTTKSIISCDHAENFSYSHFINKRISRLYPLLIIICTVSFVCGYLWMPPYNFQNVCYMLIGFLWVLQ